ncbi:lamin tail domain-containing protein, partial [Patescibacteria group bacterium]|nr:lamin tail domain-containing protein [Patescibacteria group bacterium]
MKLSKKLLFFIVIALFVLCLCVFVSPVEAKEMTQEEISQSIKLSNVDRANIIKSIPQAFTDEWINLVVSVSDIEDQVIVLILREAVRGKIRDYLLVEAPKELGIEILKIGYKFGKLVFTADMSALLKELELMTVKESLKYLGEWLNSNKIKVGAGDINFSYKNADKQEQKYKIQYVIVFKPESEKKGEAIIKIYSKNSLQFPFSQGSWGGLVGTGWGGLSREKISPFILTIQGEINRKQIGWWQSQFMHQYSWVSQPDISISFPAEVPEFNFTEKGFLEKIGDSITGFFKKIGNFFSPASVIEPPNIDIQEGPGILAEIKALFEDILEQLKLIGEQLSQPQQEELEQKLKQEIEEIEQEGDLEELAKKLADLKARLDELFKEINSTGAQDQEEENGDKGLIINQVCAGFNESGNEFIQIYNPTSENIVLQGNFKLKLVNSSNNVANKSIDWLKTEIPAKGYFLLVGGELIVDNKALSPDAKFSSQLTSVSGVIIEDKDGNILDKVAWGTQSKSPPQLAVETKGKILEKGLLTDQSLARENHIDTNNNELDFKLIDSPAPINSLFDTITITQNGQGEEGDNGDGEEEDEENGDNEEEQDYSGFTGGGGPAQPSISYCSQDNLTEPEHFPVIFNEIAWMGTDESSVDEWIELKNISTSTVQLENWQILDKDEQIKVSFGRNDSLGPGEFYLLERTDNETVPHITADKIYVGSLANSDETLRLFNSDCLLIDEIIATSSWPYGDNDEKRTMERGNDLSWHNYSGSGENGILGTPKQENSQVLMVNGYSGQNGDNGQDNDGQDNSATTTFANGLIISEVRANGTDEFVELYNPTDQEISLSGLYLSYFSENRDWNEPYINKPFPISTIASQEYYLIGFGDYPVLGEPIPDWSADTRNFLDANGSIGLFSCNPKIATTSTTTLSQVIAEAKNCKIDALGWGNPIVKEGEPAVPAGTDKSLARKIEPDVNGYLKYIDSDNNKSDFSSQTSTPNMRNLHNYSDLDNDGIIDSFDSITIISQDTWLTAGEYSFKNLEITNQASLFLLSDVDLTGFKGVKIIAENLVIQANSFINADNNGYSDDLEIARNYENPITLGSAGADIVLQVGSSCAGTRHGGNGGGAIILEISGILEILGTISANGEQGLENINFCPASDSGDGGSIYIITDIIKGSGKIESNGGNVYNTGAPGAGGQIALYYNQNQFTGDITAFGRTDDYLNRTGDTGTVYFSSNQDKLVIKNQKNNGVYLLENSLSGLDELEFNNTKVVVSAGAGLQAGEIFINNSLFEAGIQEVFDITANNFSLINSGIVANLNIQVVGLAIDNNSYFSADGLGHQTDEGPGSGGAEHIGASYGGVGGNNATTSVYGSITKPIDFGSGVKSISISGIADGAGGGKIFIQVANNFQLDGEIRANGKDGRTNNPAMGGGSGGSVYIIAGNFSGNGTIYTNGGKTHSSGGAGGGG